MRTTCPTTQPYSISNGDHCCRGKMSRDRSDCAYKVGCGDNKPCFTNMEVFMKIIMGCCEDWLIGWDSRWIRWLGTDFQKFLFFFVWLKWYFHYFRNWPFTLVCVNLSYMVDFRSFWEIITFSSALKYALLCLSYSIGFCAFVHPLLENRNRYHF